MENWSLASDDRQTITNSDHRSACRTVKVSSKEAVSMLGGHPCIAVLQVSALSINM